MVRPGHALAWGRPAIAWAGAQRGELEYPLRWGQLGRRDVPRARGRGFLRAGAGARCTAKGWDSWGLAVMRRLTLLEHGHREGFGGAGAAGEPDAACQIGAIYELALDGPWWTGGEREEHPATPASALAATGTGYRQPDALGTLEDALARLQRDRHAGREERNLGILLMARWAELLEIEVEHDLLSRWVLWLASHRAYRRSRSPRLLDAAAATIQSGFIGTLPALPALGTAAAPANHGLRAGAWGGSGTRERPGRQIFLLLGALSIVR